jgi:hypothetical protein
MVSQRGAIAMSVIPSALRFYHGRARQTRYKTAMI